MGGRVVDDRRLDRERAGRSFGLGRAFVETSIHVLNRLGAGDLTSRPEGGLGRVVFERPAADQIVRVEGRLRVVVQSRALERTPEPRSGRDLL